MSYVLSYSLALIQYSVRPLLFSSITVILLASGSLLLQSRIFPFLPLTLTTTLHVHISLFIYMQQAQTNMTHTDTHTQFYYTHQITNSSNIYNKHSLYPYVLSFVMHIHEEDFDENQRSAVAIVAVTDENASAVPFCTRQIAPDCSTTQILGRCPGCFI